MSASAASGASSSSSRSGDSEFWLLKVPNFLNSQIDEARAAQDARAKFQSHPDNPFAHSHAAKQQGQQQQPIGQLWIGPAKNGVRPMKLVMPPAPPSASSILTLGSAPAAPAGSSEFLLAPKPKATMLVFDPTSIPIAPAVAATADGGRAQGAQEAFKLAGTVNLVADVQPLRSSQAYQSSLAERLIAATKQAHTTKPLDTNGTPANPMGSMVAIKVRQKQPRQICPRRGAENARSLTAVADCVADSCRVPCLARVCCQLCSARR